MGVHLRGHTPVLTTGGEVNQWQETFKTCLGTKQKETPHHADGVQAISRVWGRVESSGEESRLLSTQCILCWTDAEENRFCCEA